MIKREVAIRFTTMNYVSKMFFSFLLFCQISLTAHQPEAQKPVGRVRSVVQSFRKKLDKIGKKTKIALGMVVSFVIAWAVHSRVAAPKEQLFWNLHSDNPHPPLFRPYFDYTWQEYRAVWAWSLYGGLWSEEHRLHTLLKSALSRCKQDIDVFKQGKNAKELTSSLDEYLAVIVKAITKGYFGHSNSGDMDNSAIVQTYPPDYSRYVAKSREYPGQYLQRRFSGKSPKLNDFDVLAEGGELQDTADGALLKEVAMCFTSRTQDFVMFASSEYGRFLDSKAE